MDLKQLHQLKCELLKVYRYQGLTLQELLCEFYSHINEVINSTNGLIDIVDYLVGEGLSNEVATHLNQMLIDGTFDKIISNKVDELSTNLNNQFNEMKKIIESNISESNNLIENLKIYDSRFNNIDTKNIEQDTRLKDVENKNKVQDIYIRGLFNENKDGRLSVEGEGNDLKLEGSKQGLVEVEKVVGNTFVNIANNTFNRVSDSIRRMDIKNLLKTDTTYTIISTLDTIKYQWAILNSSKTILGYNNQKVLTFTTDTSSIMVYIRFNSNYTNETKINVAELYDKIMILEGDFTNKPIPSEVFEGLQSSFEENLVTQEMVNEGLESAENLGKYKVPVRIVGKNKFDNKILSTLDGVSKATLDSKNCITFSKSLNNIKLTNCKFKLNTQYTIKYSLKWIVLNNDIPSTARGQVFKIIYTDGTTTDASLNGIIKNGWTEFTIISSSNKTISHIQLTYGYGVASVTTYIDVDSIQLEEGIAATDCEEYFERTTNVYLNSPLLENDEIVWKDGKLCHYHSMAPKNIEKVNGIYTTGDNTVAFRIANALEKEWTYRKSLCNTLRKLGSVIYDVQGYSSGDAGADLYIRINKSNLSSQDVIGANEWLQQNPTTVVYELAEPWYEPIKADKLILECANNSTLHIDTVVPVESVSASYTGNVPSVYALEETSITNTEDISVTQTAVDFLLMSSMGESLMISFLNNVKGINNLGRYFASRIIKKALSYEDVINKYPQFKNDIDTILVNEGYEYLIK